MEASPKDRHFRRLRAEVGLIDRQLPAVLGSLESEDYLSGSPATICNLMLLRFLMLQL
jgi:hypothetical protein